MMCFYKKVFVSRPILKSVRPFHRQINLFFQYSQSNSRDCTTMNPRKRRIHCLHFIRVPLFNCLVTNESNKKQFTLPTMDHLEQPKILGGGGADSVPYYLCMLPLLHQVENLKDDMGL